MQTNVMPDDLPESIEEIEKLFGEDVKDAPEEQKKDVSAQAEEEKPSAPEHQGDSRPEGVLSKDGKHLIPYGVLEEARRRERDAANKLQEISSQLEALRNAPQQTQENKDSISDLVAKAKAMEEDYPEFADLLGGLVGTVQSLKAEVSGVTKREQDARKAAEDAAALVQREREMTIEQQIREAIDSNQTLLHWEHNDVKAWDRAATLDAQLRALPEWQDRPFKERFEKVVELTRSIYPDASMPQSNIDTKAKAEQAIKQADPSFRPNSLSDLPGGMPPDKGQMDNLENMDVAKLGNMFATMPEDKIEEILARFG